MTEKKTKNIKQGRGEGQDDIPDQWCSSSKMWIERKYYLLIKLEKWK